MTPNESAAHMTELVLPQHANVLGTAFGGTILSWVDICGAISAQRHCGRIAVTVAIDDLQFLAPIRVGDIVRLESRLNAAFSTSVEVEVRVYREGARGESDALCVDAFLTFVNIGDAGTPIPVPPLDCQTPDDRRRLAEAQARRASRLSRRRATP